MIEEPLYEYDYIGEEDGLTLKVESVPWRGIAVELEELHYLQGAQFVRQLKLITYYGEFHPVEGETDIFSTTHDCLLKMYNSILKLTRKLEKY